MEGKNLKHVPKSTPIYTNQATPTILQDDNDKFENNEDFEL